MVTKDTKKEEASSVKRRPAGEAKGEVKPAAQQADQSAAKPEVKSGDQAGAQPEVKSQSARELGRQSLDEQRAALGLDPVADKGAYEKGAPAQGTAQSVEQKKKSRVAQGADGNSLGDKPDSHSSDPGKDDPESRRAEERLAAKAMADAAARLEQEGGVQLSEAAPVVKKKT